MKTTPYILSVQCDPLGSMIAPFNGPVYLLNIWVFIWTFVCCIFSIMSDRSVYIFIWGPSCLLLDLETLCLDAVQPHHHLTDEHSLSCLTFLAGGSKLPLECLLCVKYLTLCIWLCVKLSTFSTTWLIKDIGVVWQEGETLPFQLVVQKVIVMNYPKQQTYCRFTSSSNFPWDQAST